jgi:murein DD-endopeptidase MepM/ murein hydrolase activator NlpD
MKLATLRDRHRFAPVIELPSPCEVYDFSGGYDPERARSSEYGIGRYNERRPAMYATALFTGGPAPRDIHVGIDLAAPVGTAVRAFFEGRIHLTGINPAPGDYGGTIITEHRLDADQVLWALHGHLSHASVAHRKPGEAIRSGDVIGWIGDRHENGGWNPHLHFQLSRLKPAVCDLPGVVAEGDLARALVDYPDPRCVLGPLY